MVGVKLFVLPVEEGVREGVDGVFVCFCVGGGERDCLAEAGGDVERGKEKRGY